MTRSSVSRALLFISACAFGQTANTGRALSPAEQKTAIEAVRDYTLSYLQRLPNYTCLLKTEQSVHATAGLDRSLRTTVVEEQLSFVDHKEIRKTVRIDGRAASADSGNGLPGMSYGEFGNLLGIIFDPAMNAGLRWVRTATLNNRATDVVAFHVSQSPGYLLIEPNRKTQVPFEGYIYADARSHAVLRIQMKCTMIPNDSQYQALDLTLDYKPNTVAGQEFILPSHFLLNFRTDQFAQTNSGDYANYHRFAADATIHFDGNSK